MELETLKPYIIPAAVAAWLIFRYLRGRAVSKKLPALTAAGAIFVDVRTPAEFASGSRPGSVNIPLDELAAKAGTLDKTKPVVLSCASGARSGLAAGVLRAMGFRDVTNAGSWRNTL